ncbi:hypothetical protein ACFLYT_01845 [Nanoarchaeota archaeon]
MKEKILAFVKSKGPLVPRTIGKEFKLDSMFAGAYLSELVGEKRVFVSNTKIGGSPAYYVQEQKEKLQDLYSYLNDKDKKTYDLLKQKKVLRDKEQTPLVRASLRTIKDFAVPLQVNVQPAPELFWKWYMITKEEAEPIIKESLSGVNESPEQKVEVPETKPEATETKIPYTITEEKIEAKQEEPKKEEREIKQEEPEVKSEEKKVVEVKETQKKIVSAISETKVSNDAPKPKLQQQLKVEEEKSTLKKPKKKVEANNEFLDQVNKHFLDNNIEVVHSEVVKKTEIDFVVLVPSGVGKLEYYCKAKKKKKCNEGDLGSAFVSGQTKKLPVLFVATGDLTKRAQGMLDKEFKNYLVFRKI